MTEWVAICLPIKSHWTDKMFNTEVWTGWLPVLDSLGFTMDTVYYGDKMNKYQQCFMQMSSWVLVSCGSNRKWIYKEVKCCLGSGLIVFSGINKPKI